jgi:transcriptional regulator with XRE-family HTH domain
MFAVGDGTPTSYTRQKAIWCPVVPDILGNMLLLIDIGEEISKRRKAVGLTQAELAKMARISRSTLDALENGRMGELGYMKVNNILISLGLEFKLQVAASKRPTLDDLMLENERLSAASTVSKQR